MLQTDLPGDWWKDAVVYQVYPKSFQDSDGDGIGDLRGIIDRLDHLQRLGVDVIWLSPVYRSPMDDNGYDISDYEDVDPVFGTMADLTELVERAHDAGIRLVMDLVVNHTSDEHPWFVESRSSRESPKRDWYLWRDEPNNWESFFSGSAWAFDEATGQYYLHLFSRKQPDLNWDNPEVRQAVCAMMRRWMDRGIDGFRMDVINLISKTPGLPDGEQAEGAELGNGFPLVACGPRLEDYLQEMHREVFADHPRAYLTVGEMPGVTIEQARDYTDPARREVDMVFQFEHVDLDGGPGGKFDVQPLTMPRVRQSLMAWQVGLAETGWNSLYWDNHDQPRAVSRFGDDDPVWRVRSAKTLATVLHLLRGTPYVYQGEELGMTNMPFAGLEDLRDIESLNYYRAARERGVAPEVLLAGIRAKGRDNARTPVQWDGSPHAGFTTGTPWIAVNPNHVEINAAAQVEDPESVFAHYRRLIALRHTEPVVSRGGIEPVAMEHPDLWAYTRSSDGTQLLVLASFTREPLAVPEELLDGWQDAEVVIATSDTALCDGVLAGWESVVLRRAGRR
ncbi:alpha-glucosidase [Arsenicicoccus sp. oral taxon 190]|uniref:alpha-glucosidase n=1 Tax=Arsenicicoccus sp. oral taxon 190 TaxID=1658671 RepID=UPI00067A0EEA|nr:alpha-glucosidase [Arsenicicoccus sp. oral taxon 190]AKT51968.1 alpha-amylase [Arsenicicoccus sp. oral taxon 190]